MLRGWRAACEHVIPSTACYSWAVGDDGSERTLTDESKVLDTKPASPPSIFFLFFLSDFLASPAATIQPGAASSKMSLLYTQTLVQVLEQDLPPLAGLEQAEAPMSDWAVDIPLTPGVGFPFDEEPSGAMSLEALQAVPLGLTTQHGTVDLPDFGLVDWSPEPPVIPTTVGGTESLQSDDTFGDTGTTDAEDSGWHKPPMGSLDAAVDAIESIADLFLDLEAREPSNEPTAMEPITDEQADDLAAAISSNPMAPLPSNPESSEPSKEPMIARAETSEWAASVTASLACGDPKADACKAYHPDKNALFRPKSTRPLMPDHTGSPSPGDTQGELLIRSPTRHY